MPVELDWRFGALERLGQVRMKELMDFHRQAQQTFRIAMKAWRKEAKTFDAEYDEYANDDHLVEQRDGIESLWIADIRSESSAYTRSWSAS